MPALHQLSGSMLLRLELVHSWRVHEYNLGRLSEVVVLILVEVVYDLGRLSEVMVLILVVVVYNLG